MIINFDSVTLSILCSLLFIFLVQITLHKVKSYCIRLFSETDIMEHNDQICHFEIKYTNSSPGKMFHANYVTLHVDISGMMTLLKRLNPPPPLPNKRATVISCWIDIMSVHIGKLYLLMRCTWYWFIVKMHVECNIHEIF